MKKYIKIQHTKCFVEILGSRGTPIILLHGWGQSHAFWSELTKQLSKKHRVYTLDIPGFGLSQEPDNTWSINKYAEFLHKFVSVMKIEKPVIIGHSFGGRIAAVYAANYPTEKLVLYSTSGMTHRSFVRNIERQLANLLRFVFPISIYRFHSSIFKPSVYKNDIIVNRKRAKTMLAIYQNLSGLEQVYSNITVPTLLIYGKKDYIVSKSVGKSIHQLINNSQFVILQKSTHFGHIEEPEEFYSIVERFFKDSSL